MRNGKSLVVDSEMILQFGSHLVHEPEELEFEKVVHLE